jgi:hypothetical protein
VYTVNSISDGKKKRGVCLVFRWVVNFFLRGIFIFFFRVVKKPKNRQTKTFSLLSLLSCVYPHHTLTFLAFSESSGMSTSLICCQGKKTTFFKKLRWVVSSFQFQMTRAFRLLLAGPSLYQKKTQLSPSGISYHLHSRLLRDSTKSSGTTSRDML